MKFFEDQSNYQVMLMTTKLSNYM